MLLQRVPGGIPNACQQCCNARRLDTVTAAQGPTCTARARPRHPASRRCCHWASAQTRRRPHTPATTSPAAPAGTAHTLTPPGQYVHMSPHVAHTEGRRFMKVQLARGAATWTGWSMRHLPTPATLLKLSTGGSRHLAPPGKQCMVLWLPEIRALVAARRDGKVVKLADRDRAGRCTEWRHLQSGNTVCVALAVL
jgi:hypothetical protein